jgi:hypothetical protein
MHSSKNSSNVEEEIDYDFDESNESSIGVDISDESKEEIDYDFDESNESSIGVDISDESKDISRGSKDYKHQGGRRRKWLPNISSDTDQSSVLGHRVVISRAIINGANSFDVELAKKEFQKHFNTATGKIDPKMDVIVLPIFDGVKTYYAYLEPEFDPVEQSTVRVSVYGEQMIGLPLDAPIVMTLQPHTTEKGKPAHVLSLDHFYYSSVETKDFLESKKKFSESANNWPGYGVRGMMLVRIVANVIPGVTKVSLYDAYCGKYSKGLPYNSMMYSNAMKKIKENKGKLPEGIPKTLLKHYDDIKELSGDDAIDRVIENESYYGRYGFIGRQKFPFYEVPVAKMVGTAADFKTSACISPRWHIATNFY